MLGVRELQRQRHHVNEFTAVTDCHTCFVRYSTATDSVCVAARERCVSGNYHDDGKYMH